MEAIVVRDLTFTYPQEDVPAVKHASFTVQQGDFAVLCGPSGCGKTTMLRQLKSVMAPKGILKGEILIDGVSLADMDLRTQSERIGFVQQNPDNQVVTDKVWHELAFGLESLGVETPEIRRRVAEMASFFGIQNWFYKNVTELSGGQKQLLNLASIMVMRPSVLILDEPTSQLDPIAASDFLATLGKINRELGTTVLLTEHRLEEAFTLADRAIVMDKGEVVFCGSPRDAGLALRDKGSAMFLAMPAAMRIWAAAPDGEKYADVPLTVREGKDWLKAYAEDHPLKAGEKADAKCPAASGESPVVLRAEELYYRYEKDLPDVVKGLSLEVRKGEFYAMLGGNGSGKTTSLKLLYGLAKPYRGEVHAEGTVRMLPQNPQTLFVKKTVREDLLEMLPKDDTDRKEKTARVVQLCGLQDLLDRHPYDLSGGEQQRAALAKVLLLEPDILLLDEPTKGLDAEFKQVFAAILKALQAKGVTIVMVSHDVEFCAKYADRCAMFFDGSVVSEDDPSAFFPGNTFYTTAASRMARDVLPGAVTAEDVMGSLGADVPAEAAMPAGDYRMPLPKAESSAMDSAKLSPVRKIVALVSGVSAFAMFLRFMKGQDLSSLLNEKGVAAMASDQMLQYGIFIALLVVFALSISGRSTRKDTALQTPLDKRKLSKRTVVASALILLLIPLTLFAGETWLGGRKYYFIALLVLLECMLPFFLIFEGRKPQARELVIIATLCAIGVAGRMAFFMLPSFKPVMAVTIIAGVAFGGETGFLVGAVTMLASNVMFSQGPWTPWQMFAMGIIGFLAGVLYRKGVLRRTRLSLCIFGALCAIIIYGGIMNPAAALMWMHTLDKKILITYYLTGFPVDCVHAAATWIFLWFGAEPMLEKLDRIKVKYAIIE